MTMEILLESTSNKLLVVKEFQERCLIQAFKTKKQQQYEHGGLKVTSTQDGKRSQDDDSRLCLTDDLKKLKDHMQVKLKGTSSSLKSKDRYAYHKLKDEESRLRARLKTFIE
ncbi:hypothetical protein Tco_0271405 [Tanacetum coccineum]